jgi:hypothetical protein
MPLPEVLCHVSTLVIDKDSDTADPGVHAVAQAEVDHPEPAGKRKYRLGPEMT